MLPLLRPLRCVAAVLALLIFAHGARAQAPLNEPSLGLLVHGDIFAMARQPDGGVIIGGDFTRVNGEFRYNLARLRPDGSLDPDWTTSAGSTVFAISIDDTGRIYLGGSFGYAGQQVRRHIARLNADGTLDPDWNPGASDWVQAIEVADDGAVYVAGWFRSIGGGSRNYLARLSASAGGALDTAWSPNVDDWVYDLFLDGAGALYLGGYFEHVGGLPRSYLAKVDAGGTGAVDTAWNPSPDGGVNAFAQVEGHLYVGGAFSTIDGVAQRNLARLTSAGDIDQTWAPDPDGEVRSLVVDDDGRLYAGGWFTQMRGQSHSFIARVPLAGDGTPDTTFRPDLDGSVQAIVLTEDDVHIGGMFARIGSALALGVARLDHAGMLSATNHASRDGRVTAILSVPGDGTYIGGSFDTAGGLPRSNLLRLHANRTLDTEWRADTVDHVHALASAPDGSLYVGGGSYLYAWPVWGFVHKLGKGGSLLPWTADIDGTVQALAVDTDGAVFVGGAFGSAGGAPRASIAKLSGVTGQADTAWQFDLAGAVNALALSSDGHLYVGGKFEAIDSDIENLLKLSARGNATLDAQWRAGAGSVNVLALDENAGALYVGGYFDRLGGLARANIGKLASTGAGGVDAAWNPGADARVTALALGNDGALFVGGDFIDIDDAYAARVARLGSNGRIDPRWYMGANGRVYALAIDHEDPSVLFVGGGFMNYYYHQSALVAVPTLGVPWADIGVRLDDMPGTTHPGARLRYGITVNNDGLDPAPFSSLTLPVPAGLADAQWRCLPQESTAACPEGVYGSGSGDLVTYFNIEVGAFLRFEWTATVVSDVGTSLTTTVTVNSPNTIEMDYVDNVAVDVTQIMHVVIFRDQFD